MCKFHFCYFCMREKRHESAIWSSFPPPWFRLFPWRNWSKADFRTILISSSGLRSSLMRITTVKSMTQLQPDRVRMPFPHLTPVSRSSTCQKSPSTQPAPLLQVSLMCCWKECCEHFFCYPSRCEMFADIRACFYIYVPDPWCLWKLQELLWLLCLSSCNFQSQNAEKLFKSYYAFSHPLLSCKPFVCCRSIKVELYDPQVLNTNI